jgi:protein O-mannosyl-transferase
LWERWSSLAYGLLLVTGILAVYWPVGGFDFVNFDDQLYVSENAHIHGGITWAGLKWAAQTSETANWHPVTWVSHMLDCQLYGPRPGGHHFTNLLLHAASSCLLFVVLLRLTGKRGPSFVVAALFAWHPLHVESVAWVAERKDVLSAFFFMLTLWAYVRYAEGKSEARPKSEDGSKDVASTSQHSASKPYYVLCLAFFVLGLLSKPMLVTLPFVLLLLDYWPLGRLQPKTFRGLALEKAPFLLLSTVSCGVTLWAQGRGGAITGLNDLPLPYRIGNAVLSYYRYIGKTLWPTHLAAFYPHSLPNLSWGIWLAAAALVAFSIAAWQLKNCPWVAVGWFWYVGTLVPVIGLVQVGGQAMADRYSYLPSIGLFIAAVFALSQAATRFRYGAGGLAALTGLSLAACLAVTQQQVKYWRNSETLFRHATEVTQGNFAAYNNLGNALYLQGKNEEARNCFEQAVLWKFDYPDAHCSLAITYGALNRRAEARTEFQTALQLNPKLARTHYFFGNELLAEGDAAGAKGQYETALALKPDHPEAHYELAVLLLARNEAAEASRHLREAVRLRPDWVEALNNLAWLLATQPDARLRDGKEAVQLATQVVALTHTNNPGALDTLAEALAEAGQFAEAIQTARAANRLLPPSATNELRGQIEAHLRCYQQGQPVRESSDYGAKAAQGK